MTKTSFRIPTAEDGSAIWDLVRRAHPLDENSMYCNLIQADHFGETCVIAEDQGRAAGWISGHILPADPETFFVWQVAVAPEARGKGLAGRMMEALLSREALAGIRQLQTTITEDNAASWALFRRASERLGADLGHAPRYERDTHFDGKHATEHLVTIRLPRALVPENAAGATDPTRAA